MSLLIVTAYCENDAKRCVELYNWIGKLGGIKDNRVLFVTDKATKHDTIVEVCAAAKPVCASYETMLLDKCPIGQQWPRGANWAFMHAAKKVKESYQIPFLWLEPDCSPTRKGWLEDLEREFAECGKPYMGSKMRNKPPLPEVGMWGIAVYDPGVYDVFVQTTIRRMNIAFDVAMAKVLVPQTHDTKLIQCINGPKRVPQRIKPEHILPETALIHQDKYGDVMAIKADVVLPRKTNEQVCVVQLGRVGDILNILPIVRRLSEEYWGDAIPVFVHESMVHVLDRISYAKAIPVKSDMNDPDLVERECRKKYEKVYVPQLFSKKGLEITGPSFNIAHYKKCGFEGLFPVSVVEVDNRSFDDEDNWFSSVRKTEKPLVCYNLEGQSSPFPHQEMVLDALQSLGDDVELLDLNANKTQCITDQLIALDQCAAVVTIDTATLHLAMASSCPIMAYLSNTDNKDWYGTIPMRPLRWKCRYRDAGKSVRSLKAAIRKCVKEWCEPQGEILHAVSKRPTDLERVLKAERTWGVLYSKGLMLPAHTWFWPRSTDRTMGDPRVLPYLRDPLITAIAQSKPDDIILFTNDDLAFDERTLQYVRWKLKHVPLVTASRLDVSDLNYRRLGAKHCGRDLFAAKASWVKKHLQEIPDFVAGASEWDLVLAALARKLACLESDINGITFNCGLTELPVGLLWHQSHEKTWNHEENVNTAPSQVHNRMLAEEWFRFNTPKVMLHWFKNL